MTCISELLNMCDFNTNISRVNSMNTTSLHNFVSDESLKFCMKIVNCINIDYIVVLINLFL